MKNKIKNWLKRLNKKGIITDYLGWIILGLVILVIGVVVAMILNGKLDSAMNIIKNLFRFKR